MGLGRYSGIHGLSEQSKLNSGMDFRLPKYRREVFLKFFEFHDKYKGHAGAVYSAFPYLFEKLNFYNNLEKLFSKYVKRREIMVCFHKRLLTTCSDYIFNI